ncbi:MAG: hypothetical protein LAP13_26560 [Acidobacteriia bacterium]|nr:hypothetical protein [Terriglobia bacterium]
MAFLAASGLAQESPRGRQIGIPAVQTELEFEDGQGLGPNWMVQSAWLEQAFASTRLRLRVENATNHYLNDSYFYAEILDERGRICFTALSRLRQNLELERGPLKPGGGRTLESLSANLALAAAPHLIRVYPARKGSVGSRELFTAPVPIRIPVKTWATGVPLPTPEWARLELGPMSDQIDQPVVDLALMVADVDSGGRLTGGRVLGTRSERVRGWLEELEPHLLFSPATQNFVPQRGQVLILVRAGLLRPFKEGDSVFNPEESSWVKEFLATVQGNEVPPVSVLLLSSCREFRPGVADGKARMEVAIPDCFQYYADGTDWSLEIWKPPFPTSRSIGSETSIQGRGGPFRLAQ